MSERLGVVPELWQRVVLKLFAGEELDEEAREPYDVSEAEWLELAHSRGRTPPDLYDRLEAQKRRAQDHPGKRRGFANILLCCGRRAGKTQVIALATLYTAYLLLRHPNPHALYGVQEGEPIIIAVAALTADQATKAPYGRIKSVLQDLMANRAGPVEGANLASYLDGDGIKSDTIYFQTLRDREVVNNAGKDLGSARRASVQIQASHSNQDTQRGGAIITSLLDEFGWFLVTKTEDKGEIFYDTMVKGQQQFGEDAVNFILSSPAYQYGKFYDLYTAAWSGGLPNTLALQLPSWEAQEFEERPRVTLRSLADDEKESFDWDYENGEPVEDALSKASPRFRREWGAEFEGAAAVWLEKQTVEKFFDASIPFAETGRRRRAYYMHIDPATSRDAFAVVIGHKEDDATLFDYIHRFYVAPKKEYKRREHETVYRHEDSEDGVAHIDTEDVEELLKTLLLSFNVHQVSYDQRDSHFLSGTLRRFLRDKGIHTLFKKLNHTYDYNVASAENFRRGVLEGRYRSTPSEIAREELVRLEKDRRWVVAKGKGGLDDIFDSYRAICWEARDGIEFMDSSSYGRMASSGRPASAGPKLVPTPVRGGF